MVFLQLDFGTGFFIGSMHWMISPFLVYEKHFYLYPWCFTFSDNDGNFLYSCLFNYFFKKFSIDEEKIFLKSL